MYNPGHAQLGMALPGGWIGTGWISSSAFSTARPVPWILGVVAALVGLQVPLREGEDPGAPRTEPGRPGLAKLLGPRLGQEEGRARGGAAQEAGELPGRRQVARGAGPAGRRRRGVPRRAGELGGGRDLREDGPLREGRRALPAGRRLQEGGGALHPGRQARARGGALPREGQQPRGGAALTPWPGQWTRRPSSTRRAAIRCARPRRGRRTASRSRPPRPTRSTSWRTSRSRRATRSRRALRTPRARCLAGRLYEKARQLERAVQRLLARAATSSRRPRRCSSSGSPRRRPSSSCGPRTTRRRPLAFEQAGDAVRAATLRGEQALKADRPPRRRPGSCKGRDFLRAAELYESVGMMAEAARRLRGGRELGRGRRGLHPRAASRTGRPPPTRRPGELETAAGLYEELGDDAKAGELYGRAGLTFKSGEAAARAGEREKAIALLQRVPTSDENYRARHRAAGAALHRDRPARARDRAGAQGDRQRADLGREPRLLLLAGARARGGRARRPRRSRSTRRSRPRTCSSAT